MRIAQIAPLMESVPPCLYGGTERVVSYLTEELVAQGHEVSLFASGDSITGADHVVCRQTAVRLDPRPTDPLPAYIMMMARVLELADQFDILHFHIDLLHFPVFSHSPWKTVTTLHGRQDLADLAACYKAFPSLPLVSISNAQRRPVAGANFVATIPHGLPAGRLLPTFDPRGGYLAFLGRISPEKGLEAAIDIAEAVGLPLRIAAKIDRNDVDYFHDAIEPRLGSANIQFIGEIDENAKARFLGEASALLFPIDWPEPFGLVMIEAMACGTPVLAFDRGSVREVIDEGISGCIATSVADAIRTLPKVMALDRRRIRRWFEQRFTAARMAGDYVSLYRRLTAAANGTRPRLSQGGGARDPVML